MREQFEKIYAEKVWVGGSGSGSSPTHTHSYRRFLQAFLAEKNVRTVCDLGCGDWQFSKLMDWSSVQYRGYDVVQSVVMANEKLYSSDNVSFHLYDGNCDQLPSADLLIAKDVLQHWSDNAIHAFIPTLRRFRYALITNCINPNGKTIHRDIEDGAFRHLDVAAPPFSIPGRLVLTFTNRRRLFTGLFRRVKWRKNVLLVESSTTKQEESNY